MTKETKLIYFKNPETGLIEGIDESGKVVTVQKSVDILFDHSTKAGFKEITRPDGSIYWVQDGVDVPTVSSWFYNPMLGALIAAEIAKGGALSTLNKKDKQWPSYPILARWLVVHEDFKQMIEQAEKDRAYLRFEEVSETVEETYREFKGDEDNGIAAAKLKIDALKFLVEKGDRDKFGTKPQAQGGGGVTIIVDTGIDRTPREVVEFVPKIEGSK
jgi:hypothetical protein